MVWEEPKNVVVAHGPQKEFINILNDDDFKKWHKRGGLSFVDCAHAAHSVLNGNGTRFLRHNPQTDEGARCAEDRARRGPAPFMKATIREWIKDYLKRNRLPVLEIPAALRGVDVLTRSGTRTLAIYLAMDKISLTERNAIITQLHLADMEALWITHHCDWLDQAPGVGIRTFLEPQPKHPTTQIGNVYVCVDEGLFAAGISGLVARKQPLALETVLERYLNGGLFDFTSERKPQPGESTPGQILGFVSPAVLRVQHRALQQGLFKATKDLREAQEQLETNRRETSATALKHANELREHERAKDDLLTKVEALKNDLDKTKDTLQSTQT